MDVVSGFSGFVLSLSAILPKILQKAFAKNFANFVILLPRLRRFKNQMKSNVVCCVCD